MIWGKFDYCPEGCSRNDIVYEESDVMKIKTDG